MEILRSVDQLYDVLGEFLGLEDAKSLEREEFAFRVAKEEFVREIAKKAEACETRKDNFEKLLSYIFQLSDYTALLSNMCHVTLYCKKYEELCALVNKIFVAHIGQKHYISTSARLPAERSFDRLVEIVYLSEISNKVFVEFLVSIQKKQTGPLSAWQQPALEYMQAFFLEHENWLMDFMKKNPEFKYLTLGAILHFSTTKGIDLLVQDFVYNQECDKEEVLLLLKDFKRDALVYINGAMGKANNEEALKLVEILLGMSSDNEVMARVQDLYANTKNQEIRAAISAHLGISETINVRTEKQFLYSARRKIKEPQERSLGVAFDKFCLHTESGLEVDNTVFSFIIFLFKEEKNLANLYKLKMIEGLFVKEELQTFVHKLFDVLKAKGDILQAKWVVRMYALLSSSARMNENFDFLTRLLKEMRYKEAKYFIMALIYAKRVEIVDFIKESLEEDHALIRDNLPEFIKTISLCLSMDEEDIKDTFVPNQFSVGEFDIQRDRLFSAFIAGKMYPMPLFKKMFLENKIYNTLAQNLVFGEYRAGRLYNAFVIDETTIKFIVGASIFEGDADKDAEIVIGIIHPLEMDFKFHKAAEYFPSPTFDQFKPAKFSTADHALSATSVNRFVGMMINPEKFLQYVEAYGFRPNKLEDEETFVSMVHLFPLVNIVTEVEFQKPCVDGAMYNSLARVCFYKISDTMRSQNKFLTEKSHALPLSTVPNRYFNYVLSIIFEASKL